MFLSSRLPDAGFVNVTRPLTRPGGRALGDAVCWDHPAMSCECAAPLTVQLHDGGSRYPVVPVDRHSEVSYFFDARCTRCGVRHGDPFARVDEEGQVLTDQTADLPWEDLMWFRKQCGPFTCGCDADSLTPQTATRDA
ncbi:hypothetical protein [Streptomyces sp. TR06-5]|uniref:hypothetical protein n=1 Tax=Streptomyces sp. TR06-5 TaxID=3385976 RepID=UPI0039A22F80